MHDAPSQTQDTEMIEKNLHNKKIFLNCSYSEGQIVKKMGAKWDPNWRIWYITSKEDLPKFKKWIFKEENSV